jgi:mannose-6-phosphate isomerase-like protein (cupin superfamily)
MGNYDNVEVQGRERERVIEAIRQQMDQWGLTLPNVTPVILHFGLNRFMEIGESEFWIADEPENGYCGKFLFLFDGQTCPYHEHKMKHETFFIVKGNIRMTVDDQWHVMSEGDLLKMPAKTGHSFTAIGPALVLEVSMPSVLNDNFFRDRNIGNNGVI